MRLVVLIFPALLLATGCRHTSQPRPGDFSAVPGLPNTTVAPTAVAKKTSNPAAPSHPSTLIVTPETSLSGKVARVNSAGHFVVLSFPVGHLPATEQQLNVYRLGLKVGEVKVSDLHKDDIVVADIVAGEVFEGDEVRDR